MWADGTGQHSASFAFWSVTGAQDGASVSTDPSLSINVGDADVAATAWYLPGGGNGNGDGVYIDSFDLNAGMFVDDDFVSISPDAGLTAGANNDGFVPTASLEQVNAFGAIHGVPFEEWLVVTGQEPVSYEDLTANQGTSAVAFAFYHATRLQVRLPRVPIDATWVSWGVTVDGGGPTGRGPVPPWTPFIRELAAAFAVAEAGALLSRELRAGALDLAARQVMKAAHDIAEKMKAGGASNEL
jgi:hypothetical protein